MIALDTSAIVAIALNEPEAEVFDRAIGWLNAIVGTPTLVEAHLVLAGKMPDFAESFLRSFVVPPEVRAVDFTMEMSGLAAGAFNRFGKGRGHPAKLNICDCMAYAVAKAYSVPLLFKGDDFSHTDIVPALP